MNKIYNKIIELDGNCFEKGSNLQCTNCPFKNKCLVKMINGIPVSNQTRIELALDAIIEEVILG